MYGSKFSTASAPAPTSQSYFQPHSHPHPQTKLVNRIHTRNCNTRNLRTEPVTLPAQTLNFKLHPHPK